MFSYLDEESQSRITEYAELEEIHQDHGVKPLTLPSTTQESHHMPESFVQALLELCHVGAVTTALF